MTTTAEPKPPREVPSTSQPHSPFEDVFGLATGAVVVSLGLFLLKSGGAVTVGTAGIALLLSYVTHLAFSGIYFVVTLPFLVLGYAKKGLTFALRTLIAVVAVSALTYLHPHAVHLDELNPVYAVLLGNLLAGIGMLILFRHDSSLGGINTADRAGADRHPRGVRPDELRFVHHCDLADRGSGTHHAVVVVRARVAQPGSRPQSPTWSLPRPLNRSR